LYLFSACVVAVKFRFVREIGISVMADLDDFGYPQAAYIVWKDFCLIMQQLAQGWFNLYKEDDMARQIDRWLWSYQERYDVRYCTFFRVCYVSVMCCVCVCFVQV